MHELSAAMIEEYVGDPVLNHHVRVAHLLEFEFGVRELPEGRGGIGQEEAGLAPGCAIVVGDADPERNGTYLSPLWDGFDGAFLG